MFVLGTTLGIKGTSPMKQTLILMVDVPDDFISLVFIFHSLNLLFILAISFCVASTRFHVISALSSCVLMSIDMRRPSQRTSNCKQNYRGASFGRQRGALDGVHTKKGSFAMHSSVLARRCRCHHHGRPALCLCFGTIDINNQHGGSLGRSMSVLRDGCFVQSLQALESRVG